MYCNRCGSALHATAQFCPACGARVPQGPLPVETIAPNVLASPAAGRVSRHISLLAALWLANGVLRLLEVFSFTFVGHWLLPSIFGARSLGGLGFPFRIGWWPVSAGLAWIAVLFGIFGVIHLMLAWGLYERKVWARPLGLVIGFLALIRFPLGTALGIYTLWVLLPELSGREYQQIAVP